MTDQASQLREMVQAKSDAAADDDAAWSLADAPSFAHGLPARIAASAGPALAETEESEFRNDPIIRARLADLPRDGRDGGLAEELRGQQARGLK
jgi:hypothetical protein